MPSGSGGADLGGGDTRGHGLVVDWRSLKSLERGCPDGMESHLGSPNRGCQSHGDQLSLSVWVSQGTVDLQLRQVSWTHTTVRQECQLKIFSVSGWICKVGYLN